jgi:ribonuclease P protein component
MASMPAPAYNLVTLRRRSEFLRIRNGLRWATGAFVLEAKSREGWVPPVPIAPELTRFGLTVTKKLGSAVHRNRIRRRLKSALRLAAPGRAKLDFDYVVIARAPAETNIFAHLVADLVAAFEGIHSRRPQSKSAKRPAQSRNSSPP